MANITREQSAKINHFVSELERKTREIVVAYIKIPNSPDCSAEVIELKHRYGQEFDALADRVEQLRQEVGVRYEFLQPELQRRLFN